LESDKTVKVSPSRFDAFSNISSNSIEQAIMKGEREKQLETMVVSNIFSLVK
jgi:hypothetical protein